MGTVRRLLNYGGGDMLAIPKQVDAVSMDSGIVSVGRVDEPLSAIDQQGSEFANVFEFMAGNLEYEFHSLTPPAQTGPFVAG